MPTYVFERECIRNSHLQLAVDVVAGDEITARGRAIREFIRGKQCKICGSLLRFTFDGNPSLIDGQPPTPPKSR